MRERNWAGNYTYVAARVHRPTSIGELQEVVSRLPRVRVLGTRHSFNAIADSAELVSLDGLPAEVVVDHGSSSATFSAWLTYGEVAGALHREGVALHNLASLPHISVAGAVSTATHGSGDRNGNLATAVGAVELVASDGAPVRSARGDADFEGMVVGLGALGAITRMTVDVEPTYDIRQDVFEGLSWNALDDDFDEVMGAGSSVSVFTRWGDRVDQVWVKSKGAGPSELFDARPATEHRHPILGADAVHCTPQLGRSGPWLERLPHFRMGFTPSSGDELQSEFFVQRDATRDAIERLRALGDLVRPVLQVAEIRTIASDGLWMSPQFARDSVGLHFTWIADRDAVDPALHAVEAALAPLAARPHWGKLFHATASEVARLYPRLPDFVRLVERLDPRGAFRNDWLDTHVFGA